MVENTEISDKIKFLALNEIRQVSYNKFKEFVERHLSTLPDDISAWGPRFSIFALDLKPELITTFVLQLGTNPSWGKEWLEDVVQVNRHEYPLLVVFSKASLETLTELYIWLHTNYTAEKEPIHEGAFIPNTDDMIYEFIGGIFSLITDYKSNNVESALVTINQAFPEEKWLNDHILRARRKDLFLSANFYSSEQIRKLYSDERSIVINSAQDLLAIVWKALCAYQDFLTGARHQRVEDLWNNLGGHQINLNMKKIF